MRPPSSNNPCLTAVAALILALFTLTVSGGCGKTVVTAFPDDFVGVGVELTMAADHPRVVRTLDGGPAAIAGLKPDDVITAINDIPTEGFALADIVSKLRGAAGSRVVLAVQRSGAPMSVTIVRAAMQKHGSDYKLSAAK